MQQIEERQRRNIQKSRPYFEEKQLCQEQLETQKERINELEIQIKSTKASYAMSLKNLEKISEEIHRTRGTDLGISPPGPKLPPREPGVGATDDDDFEDPGSNGTMKMGCNNSNLKNMQIADIMNQMENDNSLDTTSLDTNSIFSEDKDDEDYMQSLKETSSMKRGNLGGDGAGAGCSIIETNSRNEPIDPSALNEFENNELNLEELRQKVKILAVRPVEGGDGKTKDCWESELNETVNKLDRLMMLQENNTNVGRNAAATAPPPPQQPSSILTGGLADKPPKPFKHSLTNSKNSFHHAPATTKNHAEPTNCIPINSQTTSTTKTFLNNSLQAVQDLLPISQTSTSSSFTSSTSTSTSSSSSSNAKELPLLSRISNEISANTANTVKVLKRRLSLN